MNCCGFAPLEPQLPQGQGEQAGMLQEAGVCLMVKPEPRRCNWNSLADYLMLYKPSQQKPVTYGVVPLGAGLEDLPVCPTGSGLAFITADSTGERLFFPSPLELNSDIAAPSSETPWEGPSTSGGRGELGHAGRELHPAFLLTPPGTRDSM